MHVDAHEVGGAHAEKVLQDGEHGDGGKKQRQEFSARREHFEARHEADGGEEPEHQKFLQRRIKRHLDESRVFERGEQQGADHPPDDRGRNGKFLQNPDAVFDDRTQPVRGDGQCYRLNHVDFDE